MKKNTALIMVIVFVVLIGLGVAGYFIFKKGEETNIQAKYLFFSSALESSK
jgi:hypothetical protein